MKEWLCMERLTYQYPEATSPSLRDLNVTIGQGEFVLLLGASGSGKSTFLRACNGLVPRFYGGHITGEVRLAGKPLDRLSQREIVAQVGFLHQDPERQLLLDSVQRELVFGMENLGFTQTEMKARLAEISHLFGLGPLLRREVATLSGGEKQRVALAGVLAPYPQALLLDEPTSQLDPIHAEEMLHALRRLHEDWGMTILLSEHRLDRCFHLADRILLFEQGEIVFHGGKRAFCEAARREHAEWQMFLPPIARHLLAEGWNQEEPLPLTVKEARTLVGVDGKEQARIRPIDLRDKREMMLAVEKAQVSYTGQEQPILSHLTYSLYEQDRIALFGENGAGKSTLLKLLAGVVSPSKGSLYWQGQKVTPAFWSNAWRNIGYLSQNPNDYFLHDTVEAELMFSVGQRAEERARQIERVGELLRVFDLTLYRYRHPHDLSGGERQRLALAIVMAGTPDVLLLDEPTRGLDLVQKEKLCRLLHTLPVKAVLLVTHDVEFAALYANRVSVLFQGEVVADGEPDEVFSHSFYYMPQVRKLYRS